MGYTMTADEVRFWQEQAALLDPDAYAIVSGANQSLTVASGEHYYVVSAWYIQATAGHWFQRHANVNEALILPEGRVLTTHASDALSFIYYCRPSLVVDDAGDDRYNDYQNDPRALYFERMMRLGELTQYTIGAVQTGSSFTETTFPTDFDDALAVHVSSHDVSWSAIIHTSGIFAMPMQDEISDSDRTRFASAQLAPFKRTVWPKWKVNGASQSEGRGVLTYVKLPSDW